MEEKNSKANPERFKLQFQGTAYRDIDEFIIDLRNIFTQMFEAYSRYREDTKNILDKRPRLKIMQEHLKPLQEELQNKLLYITDTSKIDESIIGEKRSKLIQLKNLNTYTDLTVNTEEQINKLFDFFYNRILEEKIAITGKFIPRKKDDSVAG